MKVEETNDETAADEPPLHAKNSQSSQNSQNAKSVLGTQNSQKIDPALSLAMLEKQFASYTVADKENNEEKEGGELKVQEMTDEEYNTYMRQMANNVASPVPQNQNKQLTSPEVRQNLHSQFESQVEVDENDDGVSSSKKKKQFKLPKETKTFKNPHILNPIQLAVNQNLQVQDHNNWFY